MIKFTNIAITAGLFLICSCFVHAQNIPFSNGSLIEAKQKFEGKRWLMVLWSLDCPACFKELKLIQKLQQENTKIALNVIFINADDNDEMSKERQDVIKQYDMSSFSNYYFADGEGDASRYKIDPQWYGELPRSYFIDEQGKFHGKSGLLDASLIRKWLAYSQYSNDL